MVCVHFIRVILPVSARGSLLETLLPWMERSLDHWKEVFLNSLDRDRLRRGVPPELWKVFKDEMLSRTIPCFSLVVIAVVASDARPAQNFPVAEFSSRVLRVFQGQVFQGTGFSGQGSRDRVSNSRPDFRPSRSRRNNSTMRLTRFPRGSHRDPGGIRPGFSCV